MDEYISREEAVKKIKSCIFAADDAWESGYNTAMAEIMECIKRITPADVQPVKHAHWEICCDGYYPYCSNCKNEPQGREMTDFCPNCGSFMKDGDSE